MFHRYSGPDLCLLGLYTIYTGLRYKQTLHGFFSSGNSIQVNQRCYSVTLLKNKNESEKPRT